MLFIWIQKFSLAQSPDFLDRFTEAVTCLWIDLRLTNHANFTLLEFSLQFLNLVFQLSFDTFNGAIGTNSALVFRVVKTRFLTYFTLLNNIFLLLLQKILIFAGELGFWRCICFMKRRLLSFWEETGCLFFVWPRIVARLWVVKLLSRWKLLITFDALVWQKWAVMPKIRFIFEFT